MLVSILLSVILSGIPYTHTIYLIIIIIIIIRKLIHESDFLFNIKIIHGLPPFCPTFQKEPVSCTVNQKVRN